VSFCKKVNLRIAYLNLRDHNRKENNMNIDSDNDCVWLSGKYAEYFEKVKDAVTKLYKENIHEELPYFTPHGIDHCKAVEDLIRLITLNKDEKVYRDLSEKERFCLSASAWLHDLGMLPSVFKLMNPNITPDPIFIREKHHKTTADFIVENYMRCNIESEDKELLAEMCFYHRIREPISNCKREFIVGFNKEKNRIKLRLLAAYLRLADSLHVDISRAPDHDYNICLAYSIPPDSKVHWIKSQVVNGIDIDCDKRLITVSFKEPHPEPSDNEKPTHEFKEKLNSIIRIVMNSLRAELTSVMNVLLDYNITYFIDIVKSRQPVYMSKQMRNDLNELVLNYDIMEHPSASKLLEMTIETIGNISGYNFHIDEKPVRFRKEHEVSFEEIKTTIKRKFLDILYKDVKRTRPCHKGIDNLYRSLDLIQEKSQSVTEYGTRLYKLHRQYKSASNDIINYASEYFKKQLQSELSDTKKYNIVLFGYSQSVINALIGFRDAVIKNDLPGLDDKLEGEYGDKIEEKYSDSFRLFICEGSPKTQVGMGNRLLYHDGTQYALALKRINFLNLKIVPDIIVGNIFENVKNENCFLMVGANGFDEEYFMHSAGHGSIIKVVNEINRENDDGKIKIILVVSDNKKDMGIKHGNYDGSEDRKKNKSNPEKIDGCLFWRRSNGEATRKHIWLPRDERIINELKDKEIVFYNPREDKIKIDELDFIISNTGYHPIKDEKPDTLKSNKDKFHKTINECNQFNAEELIRARNPSA
jgi:hypothetical protein